jgi:aminopeptidase N
LKDFFARWIYGTGHPRYELSWEWKTNTKKVRLVLRQLQTEPAFPNALPVDILTATGKRRVILKPTGKQTIEEVKLSEPPTTVNIDPDNTVLKEAQAIKAR